MLEPLIQEHKDEMAKLQKALEDGEDEIQKLEEENT